MGADSLFERENVADLGSDRAPREQAEEAIDEADVNASNVNAM